MAYVNLFFQWRMLRLYLDGEVKRMAALV